MSKTPPVVRPRAVLVGVQFPSVTDTEHAADLAELKRLVHTLGYDAVATVSQRRGALATGTVLGKGKLKDLAALTGGPGVITSGARDRTSKARAKWEAAEEDSEAEETSEEGTEATDSESEDTEAEDSETEGTETEGTESEDTEAEDSETDDSEAEDVDEDDDASEPEEDVSGPRPTVVVVDHELSPSQLRNLEKATGAQVMDRTGVIVDIFHRHARSHEARMQVEIARLTYLAPRLRESSGGRERQQGRGAGDSAVELDRRKIRDRLAELRAGLAVIQKEQDHRRYARREQLRVALVGYTNAGKSSLMRALTGSEVLVADQLFATLDTTVRALHPETRPRVLVSDTVGFIQKLPHDLVASFRSTLDEALEASLLLYVVDASDPTWKLQLEVTRSVLREIGAHTVPSKLLLNKTDRLDQAAQDALRAEHPEAVLLSAHRPDDVAKLRQVIIQFFEASMVEAHLVIPYASQGRIGEVYEHTTVLNEEYDEHGRKLRVRGLPAAIARLTQAFQA
ncbi:MULTISPECIES: GTPase HflX [Myxococcus]|uniref:GTPase HflX n=1 Tax=Myxococcus llanfairpwllgwyngyllgogerychwyrndrobwllllantysiliogogogochensis TaxID=2590453 RepID=A0A540X6C7_9BACT|nr:MULTISPECIES: GTPase HflX [Myxococcus]NTX09073.1 GTPase HflX [Myxococcus sp. CA040A]TQF16816.1 GTPase HflX [Myxococcus llanfairpwllgwyngyllgogerychwyrndrobwllllantysiliogogogochensis]